MAKDGAKDRQFKVLKFLGKGSYGSVFLVQRLADSQTYALKEMDVRSMSQAEREDSINEIRLLASVNHPNVVCYNEAFLDGNRLCIIMEYAADGDLAKVIKKQQMMKRPLPEDMIWKYFIQVVMGLQALHGMKILHRDIKPGNIMVFDNGVAKIGDLGIAKLLTKTAAAKTQIGTPHYMGPEIWKNRPYSYTSDTWAIGCLLYELTALAVPFEARSMSELRYKVLRGTYPPIPNTFSRDLQQMVRECLDPNPDKRPTMDQILASAAVQSRVKLVPHESRHPPATAGSNLVETIKVPRGNIAAIKNKLPPAQYATDMLNIGNGPGGHAQMATIEEGSEDGTTGRLPPPHAPPQYQHQPARAPPAAAVNRVPNGMPPMPPMPKPNYPPPMKAAAAAYPPPAPSAAAGGKLPQLPGHNGGAMGNDNVSAAAAAYNARLAAAGLRPPQLNAVPPPAPPSHGGASAWSYAQAPGGAGRGVSESHANYGAFYHHSGYTPNSGAAARAQQQQPAPWQAGNKWPPQQQQQQGPQSQYQSPYISPYGGQQQQQQQQQQQRQYGGGGGGGLHLPQLAQRPQVAVNSKPPPWNYGGQARRQQGNARGAAGIAGARPGGHYAGDLGGSPDARVPSYPPPQWAPRPARGW
ncbi:hypothetical protein HYH02_013452 [Chlamydomonas schloesseri]|uniref:non-specific serine/threonine protein kinase n=1 Tax=Chlamydomonas schloesseri TaxID=2026947 RepID=A0A835VZF4_9CHLO|nr:hypothetical protein HYH02_013452 [Chlamydomonas schloesseri]|eukprot:KAG2431324.1 hypothetical protein HYH02_013452 [Chlamydomonas schloesseri]